MLKKPVMLQGENAEASPVVSPNPPQVWPKRPIALFQTILSVASKNEESLEVRENPVDQLPMTDLFARLFMLN
jgi:hypothetical protein